VLFADTIDGVKVNAIMHSIVETAKANGVNVRYYLQYLFEQIPLRRARGDTGFMADIMPWSDAYKEYEAKKLREQQSMFGRLFPAPDRPRSPRKRDMAGNEAYRQKAVGTTIGKSA
jgi:transposase